MQQKADVPPTIRLAGAEDRDAIAQLVGEAFMDDPVSGWAFPDEETRRIVHPRFFGVFVDLALGEGWVDMMDDGSAAALWLPVTGDEHAEDGEDELARLLIEAGGNERAALLGEMTAEIHPTEPHYYLPMISVAPGRQGTGLGARLITHVAERCDREGMGAYLEASSARSKALYERLGFVFSGKTVDLPGGPQMWPMWREPRG